MTEGQNPQAEMIRRIVSKVENLDETPEQAPQIGRAGAIKEALRRATENLAAEKNLTQDEALPTIDDATEDEQPTEPAEPLQDMEAVKAAVDEVAASEEFQETVNAAESSNGPGFDREAYIRELTASVMGVFESTLAKNADVKKKEHIRGTYSNDNIREASIQAQSLQAGLTRGQK